ncbi:bromodomain containing protein, putative [Entamoeba invadens IP1]|uniref:Bromodomain containing protein, putative n=1 Tax=Entamoeba invadens IP1 TaxID=370355 RepID=A0A0A1UE70_ENTIV|nr:bromodomain containing protein, putative [Entamoeba invadens IP1]ELP92066.1 bromodomain containing protein, putative [Entamoeba invadens IP1]|eukprot:XP_004258837.1 bromodomain containing protein, putative [Entamoeba invadens IP1]
MYDVVDRLRSGKCQFSDIKFVKEKEELGYEQHNKDIFESLYNNNTGEYTLINTDVKVHRYVLVSRCDFFKQYFSMPSQEKLELSDDALKALIDWIYIDNSSPDMKICVEILNFLQKYRVNEPIECFTEQMVDLLSDSLREGNVSMWEIPKAFFLVDAHRRYFDAAFRRVSEIVVDYAIGAKRPEMMGELLPYCLFVIKDKLQFPSIKQHEKNKKHKAKKKVEEVDTDFTLTLLHQEKLNKPIAPNKEEKGETTINRKLEKKETKESKEKRGKSDTGKNKEKHEKKVKREKDLDEDKFEIELPKVEEDTGMKVESPMEIDAFEIVVKEEKVEQPIQEIVMSNTLPRHPMNKTNITQLNKLIQSLSKNKNAYAFMVKVDPEASGALNYYDVIKHPMDLGTVKKKIKDKQYTYAEDVLDDIALIWANAFTYNTVGSEIYNMAKSLSDLFNLKIQTIVFTSE